MSTTDSNWLDHWEFDDLSMVTTNETKQSSVLIEYCNGTNGVLSSEDEEEEEVNTGEIELHRPAENSCRSTANKNSDFDAPYVSRLYQLCYDTGTDMENITNNEEDSTVSEKPIVIKDKAVEETNHITPHRNNREEIRRKLAMGSDNEDYYGGERGPRKPSLQSRLQSGMNLQICFMNETANESETVAGVALENSLLTGATLHSADPTTMQNNTDSNTINQTPVVNENAAGAEQEPTNFISKQARLQAEARVALAQAKQMARMQMEVEKQRKKKSPIAEIVGIPFPDGKYKLSRHALSEMNLAQLQVIVNDLHTQIENLNEELVRLLLERDDLHMEQDSMLVDIEDLTRYL